jgi:hypothetical protein
MNNKIRTRLVFAFIVACSIAFWITSTGCCGILQLDHC